MKRLLAAVVIIIFLMSLVGCEIVTLSKPEDVVCKLLEPDSLMSLLDELKNNNDIWTTPDGEPLYHQFFYDIDSFPVWKKYLYDNAKHVEYGISDVAIRGDTATVTAVITYWDLAPVVEKTFDLMFDRLVDSNQLNGQDGEIDEEATFELLADLFRESFLESLKTTKTSETFLKIRFKCVKEQGTWVLNNIPDELILSVLFCDLQDAVQESADSLINKLT